MKFYTCVIFFICTSLMNAQNEAVQNILEQVEEINSQKSSYKFIKRVETVSAFYYVYYDNDSVQIIQVMQLDEGVEKKVSWYYQQGELLFSETVWTAPDTGRDHKIERTYHQQGKLVAWEKKPGEFEPENSDQFQKLEKDLEKYNSRMLSEARSFLH